MAFTYQCIGGLETPHLEDVFGWGPALVASPTTHNYIILMAVVVVRYGSLGGDDIGHAVAENTYLIC